MGSHEEWEELVDRVRENKGPLRARHLARLYDVAVRDGLMFLASYERVFGREHLVDLVHDLLAAKLDDILRAETPRAFFCTALKRRAHSWRRYEGSRVEETPLESAGPSAATDASEGARHAFVLDAREVLADASERDRGIAYAVGAGEDPEVVAREFKTTRDNVYQVMRRLRKRFHAGDS